MTIYNLARSVPNHYPYAVDYAPDHAPTEFYLSSGDARNGNGTFLSAREALEPQWRGDIESAGALWIVPFLERIANGESITINEVLNAYHTVHGHKPTTQQWPAK